MKPLIPILVVATTSLAVASVQFAQQSSAQRKRADTELQARQKQDARVVELERNQARLERELMMMRQGSAVAAAGAMNPPRSPGGRPPGLGAFGATSTEPGAPGAPPPFEMRGGRGPFDSPAGRNYMRTRFKTQIRRLYGDAGQAMGLSAEKGNQLLDLLADQQTRNMGGLRDKIPEGQTIQQYMQDQQKKNTEEINALIGSDKVDAWATYQKSLPQRAELGAVRDQLDQAGYPMTDSQRTDMLAAITEESQRLPRPTVSQGVPPEETAAQMNQWQTEYNKAVLDRAKQVLNTDQYSAYKEYQDWQTEVRSSMPRMSPGVAVRGVQSNGVGVGPSVSFTMAAPVQALPPQPEQTPRK
ncbi:MAG: hypothetical protein WDO68_00715 [Gammaproteobacteria bacterium]